MRRALAGIGSCVALWAVTALPASADELTVQIDDAPIQTPIILAPDGSSTSTVVPGDALSGTLTVLNGSDPGTLRAYLIRDDAQGPDDLTADPWFASDVRVTASGRTDTIDGWGTASEPIGTTGQSGVQIAEVPLAAGGSTSMDVTVDFPTETTSGNRAGGSGYSPGERTATFSVYLVIVGDDAEPTIPAPSSAPATPVTPEPSASAPVPAPASPAATGEMAPLARTGIGIGAAVLVIASGALGLALLSSWRKRAEGR